jgi:2-polyprenyl-3-methyl-5-hydroxy-6-metoxy-1,4-benzoquinol methylase
MDNIGRFNRVADVSKLAGCNTRNVAYRWSIFEDSLKSVPVQGRVLDFGAGSLRESYDLTLKGYRVTSVDMDQELLSRYAAEYDWPSSKPTLVAGTDPIDSLQKVAGQKFDLITCFDVLEHLEDPAQVLRMLRSSMSPGARMFVTVPNGRSLFELALRLDLIISRLTKRKLQPGEPHLQRKSPRAWARIIESAGLKIEAHDMQIGFFVNTTFALIQVPMLLAGRVLRKFGVNIDGAKTSSRICNETRMATLNRVDVATKPLFGSLYGWNLFVISSAE